MPHYIVNHNAQPNGDHEVHRTDTCTRLPIKQNQMALGWYDSCRLAVDAARRIGFDRTNGCYFCIPECHTT